MCGFAKNVKSFMSFLKCFLIVFVLVVCLQAAEPESSLCQPGWHSWMTVPGVYGFIDDMVFWDPNKQPPETELLICGGYIMFAGDTPANNLVAWDGFSWQPLCQQLEGIVRSLQVYDDGTGEALYVAGYFSSIDGIAFNSIAKWDGLHWSDVGGGLISGSNDYIQTLFVYDGKLIAAGRFSNIGSVSANNIASWDGTVWQPLGQGIKRTQWSPLVYSLAEYENNLIVGGSFDIAGDNTANNIAVWDGQQWTELGQGITGSVYTLLNCDGKLYVGGDFTSAGGVPVNYIAAWDGQDWDDLGGGVGGDWPYVWTLEQYNDQLLVGGDFETVAGLFAGGLAKWDGQNWSVFDPGMPLGDDYYSFIGAFAVSSDAFYISGEFKRIADTHVKNIAMFNGTKWQPLGMGINDLVNSAAVFDDGTGPEMYVAGNFTVIGDVPANGFARYNGRQWQQCNEMIDNIRMMEVFDDGTGSAMYLACSFVTDDDETTLRVVKFDGQNYQPLGGQIKHLYWPEISCMTMFDDGNGLSLYIGGQFDTIEDMPIKNFARWNGQDWSSVGQEIIQGINCFETFTDANGLAMYIGGSFTQIEDVIVNGIARWDGRAFTALGQGVSGAAQNANVQSMAIYNDGSAEALYITGNFVTAGGITVNNIARWDGLNWSALDTGLNSGGSAMVVYDSGAGEELYVTGYFTMVADVPVNYIARWDGQQWQDLNGGLDIEGYAFTSYDDGYGNALYVMGDFGTAGGKTSAYIARWRNMCLQTDVNKDGRMNMDDYAVLAAFWMQQGCDGCDQADFNGDGIVGFEDMAMLAEWWLFGY